MTTLILVITSAFFASLLALSGQMSQQWLLFKQTKCVGLVIVLTTWLTHHTCMVMQHMQAWGSNKLIKPETQPRSFSNLARLIPVPGYLMISRLYKLFLNFVTKTQQNTLPTTEYNIPSYMCTTEYLLQLVGIKAIVYGSRSCMLAKIHVFKTTISHRFPTIKIYKGIVSWYKGYF